MFQGMFRNRGTPPDPLPIGGHEQPANEESTQIPVHQLVETPRQLPLPLVRELEQDAIMQQEPTETSNVFVESSVSQSLQQDDNMLNSQERRLILQSRQEFMNLLEIEMSHRAMEDDEDRRRRGQANMAASSSHSPPDATDAAANGVGKGGKKGK